MKDLLTALAVLQVSAVASAASDRVSAQDIQSVLQTARKSALSHFENPKDSDLMFGSVAPYYESRMSAAPCGIFVSFPS